MKKKLFVIALVMLAAAGCGKTGDSGTGPAAAGTIQSVAVEPSYHNGNWTMYNDGAVVKVVGQNLQSVEIKYDPTGTNQTSQSLGQAASLSSQQNTWALALPKSIMAANLWAEGKDASGKIIKSQDLGNVGYEVLNAYTSPTKYGFSIKYPGSFGFNTDINKVRAISYIPVCDENMVACAFLDKAAYPGTNFDGAGVSINIDKSLNTEAKCYNFKVSTNAAQQPVADVVINGVTFKSAAGGDAGAGHFDKVQVYRNFHNGLCYEIAQHVGSTSIGNYPEGTIQQFNQDEAWQRLQDVVNSFTFAGNTSAGNSSGTTGQKISVTGTTACLPHKGASPDQPQTLECAIGLKEDGTGKYYGLRNTNPPFYDTNVRVKAVGTLVDDSKSIYDTVGAIDGAVITKIQ